VQLAQIVSQRQRRRRQGAEMLTRLLDAHSGWRAAGGDTAADRLDPDVDLAASVLVVLRPSRSSIDDAIHRACSRAHVPVLLLQRDDLLYLIVPESAVAGFLPQHLAELSCRAGVSGVLGAVDRMRDAAQEAVWALGIADAERVQVVRFGDSAGLLMPRSPAEAQALVNQVLGQLVSHDRAHATHYVDTVRAFVRADGSWQQAAADLHVHKQTLGYRLRKVTELTGRGFSRTQHMAEWWFALQALDLLETAIRRVQAVPGVAAGRPVR